MKIVITYGTYDLLHFGHINLLKRAKALGDYLIVGLSSDEFNGKEKHKQCYFPYKIRKQMLKSIKYVDKVIPENGWDQKVKDIKKYKVSVFVMGSDWKNKFNSLKKYCKVVYLPRTKGISTRKIKRTIESGEYNYR